MLQNGTIAVNRQRVDFAQAAVYAQYQQALEILENPEQYSPSIVSLAESIVSVGKKTE